MLSSVLFQRRSQIPTNDTLLSSTISISWRPPMLRRQHGFPALYNRFFEHSDAVIRIYRLKKHTSRIRNTHRDTRIPYTSGQVRPCALPGTCLHSSESDSSQLPPPLALIYFILPDGPSSVHRLFLTKMPTPSQASLPWPALLI